MDKDALRTLMVDEQLHRRGIKNKKILDAFATVPRHRFIPQASQNSAYADHPVAIGENQTISQPYIVALMLEYLEIIPKDRILEIGTGSGYQTALLEILSHQVYTIERIPILAKRAESFLQELNTSSIFFRTGDGTLGWPEYAPFDKIIVSAATREIPLPLIEQLGEDGRMVLPLGDSFSQMLTLVEKKRGSIETTDICGCVFVPLVGGFGLMQPS
ncbi:MAG: protein-L-isoaspartate(D-aspartate) O-methyltransferase [Candidatus Omnitrophica bacterium]|nr:protein-L-isoaspartate(D-aspartate) O-methyltransferase [Candidatus Omnitrophota bacterium]